LAMPKSISSAYPAKSGRAQTLVKVRLYQYDGDWNNALLTIQKALQQTETKVSFIEQEAFILLCLGKIDPAQ
ncbi:MAG: hypothetical protein WCK96_19050, partial [Methylococcales bacterium]